MASSSTHNNLVQADGTFSEIVVINAFHVFTIKSLSQAKLEGLLDEDTLASAEADVMICGPALCLFFAALRSNTSPPSVPIPTSATGTTEPVSLSSATCPPIFQPFFRLWAQSVPAIQSLPSDAQHDLARIICDKPPLTAPATNEDESSSSAPVHLNRIAADLRAVAIEITQRRTFQERYALDLQSALDAGQAPPSPGMPASEKRRVAAFAPPPSYDETLSQGSHSAQSSVNSSPQRLPGTPSRLNAPLPNTPHAPGSSEGMQSLDGAVAQVPQPSATHLTVNQASTSAGASSSRHRSRPSSPTFLPPDAPAIHLIRETLYAALGEVIATTPSIIPILQTDPPRAYFSTVALAILTVSTDCLTPSGGVLTPLGHELTIAECPPAYRPLMHELGGIGTQAKRIREEDDERAMYLARSGSTEPFEPRMERLRSMLEKGVASEEERFDAAIVAANHAAGAPPLSAPPAPATASQAPEAPRPQPQAQTRGRNMSPPPPMPIPTIPGGSIAHAILSTTSANSPPPSRTSRSPPSVTSGPSAGPPFTTPTEDAQLLHATISNNSTSGTGNNSATSSPRSSSEQARGLGLRNLLHKPRPAPNEPASASSAAAPPVAPKPNPPASRYNAPSAPPPSIPVPHPPVNPAGMAGVGTAVGSGTPMASMGGVGSPPRAVMMAHQSNLSATGNPYEMALGSGARIAGSDSGVVQTPVPAPAIPVVQPEPVPTETSNPRRSVEGSTVQFANRINALALNMTRLRMFQERQDMVFKILASVRD